MEQSRIRHCRCEHLPPHAADLIARLKPLRLNTAQEDAIREILYNAPAPPHYHDRAFAHITPADGNGHIYWTGPVPKRMGPHVQYQNVRMPVAMFLWLRAGRPNVPPLVRTCHDPQCIAPAHHALKDDLRALARPALTRELEDFDLRFPRISARPKRWDRSDPRGERCYRETPERPHSFRIYGDARLRRTYCPECAQDERARLIRRQAILDKLAWATSDNAPAHTRDDYSPAQPSEPEPTLVDMLAAWDASPAAD